MDGANEGESERKGVERYKERERVSNGLKDEMGWSRVGGTVSSRRP